MKNKCELERKEVFNSERESGLALGFKPKGAIVSISNSIEEEGFKGHIKKKPSFFTSIHLTLGFIEYFHLYSWSWLFLLKGTTEGKSSTSVSLLPPFQFLPTKLKWRWWNLPKRWKFSSVCVCVCAHAAERRSVFVYLLVNENNRLYKTTSVTFLKFTVNLRVCPSVYLSTRAKEPRCENIIYYNVQRKRRRLMKRVYVTKMGEGEIAQTEDRTKSTLNGKMLSL